MKAYLAVLKIRDYRLLWTGLVLSLLGDGATFAALAWMVVDQAGAAGLGTLGVCLTLPVIAGGTVIGPILDRFSRRWLFVYDSVFRSGVVALIPLLAWLDALATWHLYAVAAVYGLLKIIPLAGTPAVLPELVPDERLQAASGLEATAMGTANVVGPALGAGLIVWIGAANVLLLDAVTYLAYAGLILLIRAPLARPERAEPADGRARVSGAAGWRPVLRLLLRDRFLLVLTLSFAAYNVSAGAMLVALPWLAKFEFSGSPGILGLLLAILAAGELIGAMVAGMMRTSDRQMLRIGLLQIVAGGVLVLLVPRSLPLVLAGLLLTGVLSGPMTVMGTVVRLTRIPAALRGRAMTLMRTTMSGALPVGSALGGFLLSGSSYTTLIVLVTVLAAAPGVLTAVTFYRSSFRLGVQPDAQPAAAR